MNRIVNYIWLVWNLTCILRTYRTIISMVGFSKYEFNNKLLCGVTLFKVISSVTWTQLIMIIIIIPTNSPCNKYTHTQKKKKSWKIS